MKFAADTSVSTDQSRAEIERTLRKYGATSFMYGWDGPRAVVGFEMHNRRIKFVLPMPDQHDPQFTHTAGRKLQRSQSQAYAAWEQACRQRWRALNLVIKAKLEAVDCGITQFEEEFLAHIVLPNGSTYGDFAIPQIAEVYETRSMPKLLSFGGK